MWLHIVINYEALLMSGAHPRGSHLIDQGHSLDFWIGNYSSGESNVWLHLRTTDRRRQWHPTPVLLPGKSHGWRSLVGCSPWVAKSRARLSDFTFTFHSHALEKEMASHSSVLAWRIPGTGSLVGCRLWGRTESDMTKATQQQQIVKNKHTQ